MLTLSHRELRERFSAACAALGAPTSATYYRTEPSHDGSPHIELFLTEYHYVVTERGSELERKVTWDPDELLYWLVSDIGFGLAGKFELEHRVPDRDSRRLMFAKQIELLGAVNAAWADRKRREIAAILEMNPYNDTAGR